jgi:eukaryotic-like serine/threonine-protein kinase
MGLTAGTRLGPYEITTLLGAGGMGEVYHARDTRLNRSVAIKVLPPHVASDPDLRQRLEREARTIAALNHPHICVLHDVGHDNGTDFFVMEHLQGETLADRLKKGSLPVDQALRYGIEMTDALDKAHRQGVVHRDLKPSNIMITPSGIKLLDFGLAKLQAQTVLPGEQSQAPTGNVDLTAQGTILGTIQYMAPEQLEGHEADARSDIFALGVVLYEMVTARKAFEGKSQASLMASILERDPRPISELQPLSPPLLEHVIQGCLAKAPDDRWQTAHDVMKQLKWIAAGGSPAGVAAAAPAPRRGRLGWIVAASLGVVLVAASLAALRYLRTPEPTEQTRFSVSTPQMPVPYNVSVSPDGRRIAFVAGGAGSTTTASLFVRPVDSVEAQPLPGTQGASAPFWSPDGRHLGFGAQGKLKRIDLSGGLPQNVCDAALFAGGTWNADGAIVFSPGMGALKRVPASGGEPVVVTALDASHRETTHAWPYFLPDGRHFLFLALGSSQADYRAIYAGSLDSKERPQVVRATSMPLYAPPGYLLFHRDGTLMAQLFDVKRLTVSGEPVRVADGVAFNPSNGRAAFAVSNTGTLLFRTGDGGAPSQLTWYNRSGRSLGTVQAPPDQYRGIGLSPDDKRIVVHRHQEPSGGDIWVLDLDRGTFTRFTLDPSHNFAPMWSHDGNFIFFSSNRGGRPPNLYQKSSSGAGNDELLLKSDFVNFPEHAAPDGQSILFGQSNPGTGIDVWILPLSGERKPKSLISTEFFDGFSKFSPDGRWIVYHSNETSRTEVYVQSYPQRSGKWQISTQGGSYPRWATSGKELFYLMDDGTVMAVDVQADGGAFKAGTPHILFKSNVIFGSHGGGGSTIDMPYDVAADSQRFLINERVGPSNQDTPITVVLNWAAALKK